jgi:hypothetical protein
MMPKLDLTPFLNEHMRQGGRYVPARIQAAMALLEKLRDSPELKLTAHKRANSSGIDSHERYGDRVHERLAIAAINKNHGRRSSNVGGWGQALLDRIGAAGFRAADPASKGVMIDHAQEALCSILRAILDQEPLDARPKGRTAEAVVRDLLRQAEAKGKSGEVAQYLVGAKLQLRLGLEIPVVAYNVGDRRSHADASARTGDFEVEDSTIEVALGLPDDKHLAQVAHALEDTDLEFWLLTRHDRVETWKNELGKFEGVDMKRVIVSGVESFIGQNISEMGGFSSGGKANRFADLVSLYNERWAAKVGTPGIRIAMK